MDEVKKLTKGVTYSVVHDHFGGCKAPNRDRLTILPLYTSYLKRAAKVLEKRPSASTLDIAFLQKILGFALLAGLWELCIFSMFSNI